MFQPQLNYVLSQLIPLTKPSTHKQNKAYKEMSVEKGLHINENLTLRDVSLMQILLLQQRH